MNDRKQPAKKPPESLARLQARFAGYIRDPGAVEPPEGLEDRRMAIYRDLFFRNLEGLFRRSFPVTRRIHDDDAWEALVRGFMTDHRARTPMFTELPREFLRFLSTRRDSGVDDPPFLAELARYEWLETALGLDETDLDSIPADPEGDIFAHPPVVSPLAWLESFEYPVHRIRPGFTPEAGGKDPTHLLLYRKRDDTVGFYLLNPVSARLFVQLRDADHRSGLEQIQDIAGQLGRSGDETVIQGGRDILEAFRQRDILLGTAPAPAVGRPDS